MLSILGIGPIVTLAASILNVAAPFIKVALEGCVSYFKIVWEGFKDIVDNIATIVTVLSIVAATYFYTASLKKETIIKEKCSISKVKKKDPSYDRFKDLFSF